MIYSNNAVTILAALTYKGIGKAWIVKNITGNEAIEQICDRLSSSRKELTTQIEFEKRRQQVIGMLEKKSDHIDGLIALGDPNFPQHRGEVKNSERPVALFYKGDISLLSKNHQNLAVIGVLEPDESTIKKEQVLVRELVQKEVVIVSGLANGCDSVAHIEALRGQGRTVAILPSPLHNIMPSNNQTLAEEIVKNKGLLVTEYLTDPASHRALIGRYQERDRLQALFSDGVILVSSYAKEDAGDSGSRLAMGYAQQYGIERYVMYDDEDAENPKYNLNRQIIAEQPNVLKIESSNLGAATSKILSSLAEANDIFSQESLF